MNKILQNTNYLCRNFTGSIKEFKFDELVEYNYYINIFQHIKQLLGFEFNNYEFLFYSKIIQHGEVSDDEIIPDKNNPHLVVFYISDETSSIPHKLASRSKSVFKVYLKKHSEGNVYYFPLGYANGEGLYPKPMRERTNNVFFIGQFTRSRIKFYKELTGLTFIPDNILLGFKRFLPSDLSKKFEKSKIAFTSGFTAGLNRKLYNEMLYNSKIIICPYGSVTYETFRHYEAMRAGCVVITLKMPLVRSFEGSPIIQLESWDQIWKSINDLLRDENRLEALSRKTLDWWEEKCSEKSVAEYVVEKIKNHDLDNNLF